MPITVSEEASQPDAHVCVGTAGERRQVRGEGARLHKIVGAAEGDDVTRGTLETLVVSSMDAAARLVDDGDLGKRGSDLERGVA